MDFIWFVITLAIGFITGAFFVAQSMALIFFAIPWSIRFKRHGILKSGQPIIRYFISLVILLVIFTAISYGMNHWLREHIYGYWFGIAISFLMGIGQCGHNDSNVEEYNKTNFEYFSDEYQLKLNDLYKKPTNPLDDI